ncbi:MAG TPA: AbgT family transporter [Oscillospiraceae bacterium]|nr:AbgT family transporter [Oscillospiraceae bacterium]HPS34893.1 AbgT family transporter [Oscillospiraceae bacterium]
MEQSEQSGIRIGKRTFISTVCILLAVMICAGVLTLALPQSSYERVIVNGYEEIVPESYTVTEGAKLPVWQWFMAPFEVLAGSDGKIAIMIILFLIFIGGTFLVLDKSGVMRYMLTSVTAKMGRHKYALLAVMTLICMAIGSTMGIFEEFAPLVPLAVALALTLGWDSLIGLGMSILAVGYGFSVGTFNPFSILVAQKLAGLPVFSGLLFRVGSFLIFYGILFTFLFLYAKKIEKNPQKSLCWESDKVMREKYRYDAQDGTLNNDALKKASFVFLGAFGLIFLYISVSLVLLYGGNGALTDYTMPMMVVLLTAGGLLAGKVSKYTKKELLRDFGKGMLAMAPGALLIIMAMSAKQIVLAGGVMDTILHGAYELMSGVGKYQAILIVFGFVLVLEFFISSASAKAFIVMPLVMPFASLLGLTRQSLVQGYCFADGFTNMFFPTNAALLIVLGLVNMSYGKWLRWGWKLTLATVAACVGLLLLAVKIGYGPA